MAEGLTKEEMDKRDKRKGRFHKEFASSSQQKYGATGFPKASITGN